MDAVFMERLQAIRTALGKPLVINSGFRCPEYNMRVSHSGRDGPHTHGQAADVHCYGSLAHQLTGLALEHGMTGLGFAQLLGSPHERRYIHMDDLTPEQAATRPWVWSYK